jgi:hypothetical protein
MVNLAKTMLVERQAVKIKTNVLLHAGKCLNVTNSVCKNSIVDATFHGL